MKSFRLPFLLLAAAALTATRPLSLCAEESTNTVKFSDPAKPGTVKINLGRGELRVQGTDTTEVSVKSEARAAPNKPRADGMRVISTTSSFALSEKDNVITLDATAPDWGKGGGNISLTVPRSTTVIVQNAWNGSVACAGISGDIEISSLHGEIKLDDIAGGVVASTMNGEIRATVRELREGKPLSFTSMNGEVILRVPPTAKANVRLRTQNGSVLTNFEESALVTKTETAGSFPRVRTSANFNGNRGLSVEIQAAIRDAVQIGVKSAREALEAIKEGVDSARMNNDEARRQVDDAKREIEKARRDAERQQRTTARANRSSDSSGPEAKPAAAPQPPQPPKLAIPTLSGGKLVTGTLNGGGPEISISTMNGDVTLQKLE